MVIPRRRPRSNDHGWNFIEVTIATGVSMIAFALVGTVLVGAQRQERFADETARTVDTARTSLARIVNEVREARSISMSGSDAQAWFDTDADGVQDAGEVHLYRFRVAGSEQELVRIIDGTTELLAEGLTTGSFSVSLSENGQRLSISVTVPGADANRSGTTLTSEVTTRGNF